ncbi:LysR family transcriptional regulator substrate-binding protein [Edaphovirga cremea]|uniref:LysR family transcriptional regulator substrate-binding protein n=1 Tax=Edaphovirga cremea TaxID=2267246 RepID=UPI00319D98BD
MSEPWHRLLALENGTLDFAIGALDSTVPTSLEIFPLLEDPFVVVAHKNDPLAKFHHLPWKQ